MESRVYVEMPKYTKPCTTRKCLEKRRKKASVRWRDKERYTVYPRKKTRNVWATPVKGSERGISKVPKLKHPGKLSWNAWRAKNTVALEGFADKYNSKWDTWWGQHKILNWITDAGIAIIPGGIEVQMAANAIRKAAGSTPWRDLKNMAVGVVTGKIFGKVMAPFKKAGGNIIRRKVAGDLTKIIRKQGWDYAPELDPHDINHPSWYAKNWGPKYTSADHAKDMARYELSKFQDNMDFTDQTGAKMGFDEVPGAPERGFGMPTWSTPLTQEAVKMPVGRHIRMPPPVKPQRFDGVRPVKAVGRIYTGMGQDDIMPD